MAVPRSWFPSGLNEGDTVTLTKPKTSKWILDKMINTHDDQCRNRSLDSYVSILFECHNPTNGQEAFMRVYVQVPHTGYEGADKATRAREAIEFTPPELKAYKSLTDKGSQNTPPLLAYELGTQGSSDIVPNGHITWIVWKKVPGKRLGDFRSAFVYWNMDRDERDRIREAFLREFPKAKRSGYFPEGAKPRNLIWDENNGDLYFVGFRDAMPFKAKGEFNEAWLPRFDLARPPQKHFRRYIDYNGDISDWKL